MMAEKTIEIGRKEVIFFVIAVLLVFVTIEVLAYNSDVDVGEPTILGHSANEVKVSFYGGGGSGKLQDYIDNRAFETSEYLADPLVLFNGIFGPVEGWNYTFNLSDNYPSIPPYASEILLYGHLGDRLSTSPNQYIRYKFPGHTSWKYLVYSRSGGQYPNSNSVWVPLDENGKLDLQVSYSGNSWSTNYTVQVHGYRYD